MVADQTLHSVLSDLGLHCLLWFVTLDIRVNIAVDVLFMGEK